MSDNFIPWHVAFDDTDSLKGMCTTYLATVITWRLVAAGARLIDFPRLIRHNPNVPKKTRGNGGVVVSAFIPARLIDSLEREIVKQVESLAHVGDDANPGLLFVRGMIPPEFEDRELVVSKIGCELVSLDEIHAVIDRLQDQWAVDVRYQAWGTGDGLVGAFGALTRQLLGSGYTFELLTYRPLSEAILPRDVPPFNLVNQLSKDFPTTLMNVDPSHDVILIFPRGPDPVICGIRGTNPDELIKFWIRLQNKTPLETMMLFRTNQHLDSHVKAFWKVHPHGKALHAARPHDVIVKVVTIVSEPVTIPGRHVFILSREHEGKLEDPSDSVTSYCWLAAYEPTKQFRNYVRHLTVGDVIQVVGSIREVSKNSITRLQHLFKDLEFFLTNEITGMTMTINLEEFLVISLASRIRVVNPRCPNCGKTLTSAGKSKGFKCKRCHGKFPSLQQLEEQVPRVLVEGKTYQVPPLAMRHVNKPKHVHLFRPPSCPRLPNDDWTEFVHRYVMVMDRLLSSRHLMS